MCFPAEISTLPNKLKWIWTKKKTFEFNDAFNLNLLFLFCKFGIFVCQSKSTCFNRCLESIKNICSPRICREFRMCATTGSHVLIPINITAARLQLYSNSTWACVCVWGSIGAYLYQMCRVSWCYKIVIDFMCIRANNNPRAATVVA